MSDGENSADTETTSEVEARNEADPGEKPVSPGSADPAESEESKTAPANGVDHDGKNEKDSGERGLVAGGTTTAVAPGTAQKSNSANGRKGPPTPWRDQSRPQGPPPPPPPSGSTGPKGNKQDQGTKGGSEEKQPKAGPKLDPNAAQPDTAALPISQTCDCSELDGYFPVKSEDGSSVVCYALTPAKGTYAEGKTACT